MQQSLSRQFPCAQFSRYKRNSRGLSIVIKAGFLPRMLAALFAVAYVEDARDAHDDQDKSTGAGRSDVESAVSVRQRAGFQLHRVVLRLRTDAWKWHDVMVIARSLYPYGVVMYAVSRG